MKVILRKDVPGVGQKDAVKEVSVGYASNMLIPRGLAVAATKEELARVEGKQKGREAKQKAALDEERSAVAVLDGATITIQAKANEQGHLFQKLDVTVIAAEIEKQKGLALPTRLVELKHPIKETGECVVALRGASSSGTFTLIVEAA